MSKLDFKMPEGWISIDCCNCSNSMEYDPLAFIPKKVYFTVRDDEKKTITVKDGYLCLVCQKEYEKVLS